MKTRQRNHLVKQGKRIIGFVYKDNKGQYWYSFGKPSADDSMAFVCNSLEAGIAAIECYRPMGHAHILI